MSLYEINESVETKAKKIIESAFDGIIPNIKNEKQLAIVAHMIAIVLADTQIPRYGEIDIVAHNYWTDVKKEIDDIFENYTDNILNL